MSRPTATRRLVQAALLLVALGAAAADNLEWPLIPVPLIPRLQLLTCLLLIGVFALDYWHERHQDSLEGVEEDTLREMFAKDVWVNRIIRVVGASFLAVPVLLEAGTHYRIWSLSRPVEMGLTVGSVSVFCLLWGWMALRLSALYRKAVSLAIKQTSRTLGRAIHQGQAEQLEQDRFVAQRPALPLGQYRN